MDRGKSNKNAILSGLGARAALTEISKVPPTAIACRCRIRVLFGDNATELGFPPLK